MKRLNYTGISLSYDLALGFRRFRVDACDVPRAAHRGFEMRSRSVLARSVPVLAGLLLAVAVQAQESAPFQAERVPPVEFGRAFPGGVFKNLNPAGPELVDLRQSIGTRPVVLYYWIAGNPRADAVFKELQAIVQEVGPDKIDLFGITFQAPGRGVEFTLQGVEKLGLSVPVLDDVGYQLGQRLRVQNVPNISLIDKEGRLRLTNGGSLTQVLEYNMDLTAAVRRLATKGTLGTYGFLPQYYPAKELVGKECPDFSAALLTDPIERRWSGMLDKNKLNVLVFWAVDCPHCRTTLPEFDDWLKQNGQGIHVVSAAKVTSEALRTKTREFCEGNDFSFPTLIDQDLRISALYQITSTPTFVIITPDGLVEDVVLQGGEVLERSLDKKRRELLNAGS